MDSGVKAAGVNPNSIVTSHVTSGKLLILTVLQFPHLNMDIMKIQYLKYRAMVKIK